MKSTPKKHDVFRKTMIEVVDEVVHDGDVLFLSGGVDSATVLFAALEAKKKISAVSFSLEGHNSIDMLVASSMAKEFKIKHHKILVRRSYEDVFPIVKIISRNKVRFRKALVQCYYLLNHAFDYVSDTKNKTAIMALYADNLFSVTRERMFQRYRDGDEYWSWARRDTHEHHRESVGDLDIIRIAKEEHDVKVIDPWDHKKVVDLLLPMSFDDLNKPQEKALAVMAFVEYWKRGNWFRTRENMHVGSGVREFHDTMLRSKYNTTGRKAIIGIYKDIQDGTIKPPSRKR